MEKSIIKLLLDVYSTLHCRYVVSHVPPIFMAHAHLLYREEHLSHTQGCTTTQQHYEGAQCTFIFCTLSSVYRDIVFHSVLHNVTTYTTVKIFPMSWPDVLCTTCTVQRRRPAHHMSHTVYNTTSDIQKFIKNKSCYTYNLHIQHVQHKHVRHAHT